MIKRKICPKTGRPHKWREIPIKRIRQRTSKTYPGRIVITDRLFECADCHIRFAPWHYAGEKPRFKGI